MVLGRRGGGQWLGRVCALELCGQCFSHRRKLRSAWNGVRVLGERASGSKGVVKRRNLTPPKQDKSMR